MPSNDIDVLRELARETADIAALPVQQEAISRWKAINRLEPVRPMVMIDQIPWHEMNVNDELTLRCEDAFCRGLECGLRAQLYKWRHMRADMVVEPFIDISKTIRGGGYGIDIVEQQAVTDPTNSVVGHHYEDQLATDEDVEKIRAPEISLDEEATARDEARAREIFDGILEVRMQGWFPMFRNWDIISMWRSAGTTLMDLAMRPDHSHRIMSKLTDAVMSELGQLESQGLLGYGQSTVHCTGAHSDELPGDGFDPAHSRPRDIWTAGMAQVFSTVSPQMHQEFELDYALPWYERFGLAYYGCCEPLHDRLDIVSKIPNLRKISMSPWVDVELGAQRIGRDFVFSRKPTPALLAVDSFAPDAVRADLQETLAACERHSTPVEFILKDISTVRYEPQRLWEWVRVAMELVDGG